MLKLLIFSTLLGCFCAPLSAQSKPYPILFNLGAHTEFYQFIQTDDSGGVRKFEADPTIGFGLKIPTAYDFLFLPELNWVLPRSAGDSQIIKNLFMLRADLAFEPIDWFRLRVGTSLMWANQQGKGGSANVNNGNGTSVFYYPDENRSSLNNTLDLGAELLMTPSWSARLQTYVYSVFLEERRQISYSLFLTYQWDQ